MKKEGPTKGRHFYRCSASLCDFFDWDQEERRAIKEGVTLSEDSVKMQATVAEAMREVQKKEEEIRVREKDIVRETKEKEAEMERMQEKASQDARDAGECHDPCEGTTESVPSPLQPMQNQMMWIMAAACEIEEGEISEKGS